MAASSTAQPPGVVKTLRDDKKRKRPVKKRRGKKLTVAESEAQAQAAGGGGGGGGGSEIVEAEASKRVAEGDADYDRKGKRPAQPAAVEAPSRTIHAPEDGCLDKDASSAELFKTITAALAFCTIVALRINKRGKKLHVEYEYGAEVAKEFDAVDPLGEKGSADYKELKKAIEKVKAKKPPSSSSREKPSSSSREPESFHRGSDDGREGGRREEKSPSGRAQFLFLAIKPARFHLREMHDMVRTKDSWSGRVNTTHRLRRDLEWWVAVPNHGNGCSIYKPVKTACMHVDSSGYGWGAVLNETTKARRFWHYRYDGELHISPTRSSRLSAGKLPSDDWAFSLRHLFNHLDNIWGRHTIDRFAENARLPRRNFHWRDPCG
eukprot:jgi/Tetstr1/436122/TSEL_024969.t1